MKRGQGKGEAHIGDHGQPVAAQTSAVDTAVPVAMLCRGGRGRRGAPWRPWPARAAR